MPKKKKKDKIDEDLEEDESEEEEEEGEEEAPKEAPEPPEEEEEEEEEEGDEEREEEEEEDREIDEGSEKEEEEVKKEKKKKSDIEKQLSDLDGDKFAKFSTIAGGVGIAVLLLRIFLDVLIWVLPFGGFIIGCFTCMIWPVFLLGFFGAVLGIILGIVGLVKGAEEKKMMAFLGIGLGAAYFFVGVAWAIFSWIMF